MENLERVECELLEQCGQAAILIECFAWLQRCDECIEQLEELCRAKRPRLAVGHRQFTMARIRDRATRRCKVAIGATFRAHWWRVHEWQRTVSYLARDQRRVRQSYIDRYMTGDKL